MKNANPSNQTPQDVNTDQAPPPVGLYPHAKRVGPFLFLSGVGPRTAEDQSIPGNRYNSDGDLIEYDIAQQCHSVFKNVKKVLEASGASWVHLVDVTVFLTDMKKDFSQFNEIYREYFQEVRPTRTTIEVGALPTPIAIELKCIAYLGSQI